MRRVTDGSMGSGKLPSPYSAGMRKAMRQEEEEEEEEDEEEEEEEREGACDEIRQG